MKKFNLTGEFMDKMAQLKLEQQALEIASLTLDHIEHEISKDKPNLDKIKQLSKVYNTLKPYF